MTDFDCNPRPRFSTYCFINPTSLTDSPSIITTAACFPSFSTFLSYLAHCASLTALLPSTLCRIPDGAQLSESAGWKNATTTATFAVFQSSLTSAHLHQQSPLTAIESELVSRPPTSTLLYPAACRGRIGCRPPPSWISNRKQLPPCTTCLKVVIMEQAQP
jgi:hypothetical protein